jgi:hypothetical protein
MDFIKTRDKIKGILHNCGVCEVHNSKAQVPESLPAGIVSLAQQFGEIKLVTGFAKQGYKFDIHLVIEDSEESDEQLIDLIEVIDNCIQDSLYTEIEKVEFYDSLLSANNVRIAKFEVIV